MYVWSNGINLEQVVHVIKYFHFILSFSIPLFLQPLLKWNKKDFYKAPKKGSLKVGPTFKDWKTLREYICIMYRYTVLGQLMDIGYRK